MIGRKKKWVNVIEEGELIAQLQLHNPYFLENAFQDLLILQKEGKLYATKTRCPHQGKSLKGCWVENDKIVCPVHQYAFSLETGRGHGLYLERYETRIHEGWFQIEKEVWSFFGFLV